MVRIVSRDERSELVKESPLDGRSMPMVTRSSKVRDGIRSQALSQGHRRPCPYVSTRVGPQARADTIGRRRSHVYCYFKAIWAYLLVTDLSRWTRLADRTFSTLAPPEGLEGARDRSGSTRALNLVWWTSSPVNTAFLSHSASWPPMSLSDATWKQNLRRIHRHLFSEWLLIALGTSKALIPCWRGAAVRGKRAGARPSATRPQETKRAGSLRTRLSSQDASGGADGTRTRDLRRDRPAF